MKKFYEAPTSELIYIASSDIITASPVDMYEDDLGDKTIDIKIGF